MTEAKELDELSLGLDLHGAELCAQSFAAP